MDNWTRNSFVIRAESYVKLARDEVLAEDFRKAYEILAETVKNNGRILVFGNGGSAAEAQHFAAELVCQFMKKRKPLSAIALTTDSSVLTAQSNDFGFEYVFSRQIEAHYRNGDAVVGFTTSDFSEDDKHSLNIFYGFQTAKSLGARPIGLFSVKTQKLLPLANVALRVPETRTDLIQEAHLALVHMLSDRLEQNLF